MNDIGPERSQFLSMWWYFQREVKANEKKKKKQNVASMLWRYLFLKIYCRIMLCIDAQDSMCCLYFSVYIIQCLVSSSYQRGEDSMNLVVSDIILKILYKCCAPLFPEQRKISSTTSIPACLKNNLGWITFNTILFIKKNNKK